MHVQMLPDAAAREDDLTRSLRIGSDDRYRKMEFYREAKNDHVSRLVARQRMAHRKETRPVLSSRGAVDATSVDDMPEANDHSGPSCAEEMLRLPAAVPLERMRVQQVGIADRAEWQDTFDRSVRRLFVDFELSDVPSCRLNHLDRMHSWFLEHGAKQQRKVMEGPSFLVADRSSEAPAGSTRNVPVKQVERPMVTGFSSGVSPRRPSSRWQRPGNLTSR